MGQNKNVLKSAVGEMKHFLLGAALVLTLITVIPVLAQDPGPGGGGGGMPGGAGGGQMGGQMSEQGGQSGQSGQRGGQQGDRGQSGQSGQRGGQQGGEGDAGFPENCPDGETGTPLNCSGATGGAAGTRGGVRGRSGQTIGAEDSENVNGGREGGGEEGLGRGGKGKSTGRGQGRGQGRERAPGQTGVYPEKGEGLDAGQGESETSQGHEADPRSRGKKSDVTPEPFGKEGSGGSEGGGKMRSDKFGQGGQYGEPIDYKAFKSSFDFNKFVPKKLPKKLEIPEIDTTDEAGEQLEALKKAVAKLHGIKSKKKVRENSIVLAIQLERFCDSEELECSFLEDLADVLKSKRSSKNVVLEALTEASRGIQEEFESGGGFGGENDDEFGGEEEPDPSF